MLPSQKYAKIKGMKKSSLPSESMKETAKTEQTPKQRDNHKGVIITGLIGLLLVVLTSGGVYYWQHTALRNAQKQQAATATQLNDTKTQLAKAQADNVALQDKLAANQTKTQSDTDLVKAALIADCEAPVGNVVTPVIRSLNVGAAFASGVIGCQGPAGEPPTLEYAAVLKKVTGQWIVVYHGQTPPSADVVGEFAIPAPFKDAGL